MNDNFHIKQTGKKSKNTVIVNPATEKSNVPIVERISSEPVTIQGRKFKNHWLLISGAVGFAANAVTIGQGGGFLFENLWISCFFFIGPVLLLIYFAFLSGNSFSFGGTTIVCREGTLFNEVYKFPPCPHCGGKLNLIYGKDYKRYLQCSIYPDNIHHNFHFTPKIFDPRYYPKDNNLG